MATKILALLMTLGVIALLVAAGNTSATSLSSSTLSTTKVAALTEAATAELTEIPTEEATAAVVVGDPVRGEEIFRHGLDGAPPCVTCHNPTAVGKNGFAIGPGLKGIGERAATRIEGMTATQYLEDSIRHPANYLVMGFNPIMPPIFGEQYSDQTIVDLVAYLMTL